MEIRYLRLIKAIEEEGGITQAIGVLHLSQSALSYQLKEAESQIGTPIFYRKNKKLILTPVGKKLYETAKKVIAEIDQTTNEIKRIVRGESGIIRISTECYTSYHWLPSVLKKFKGLFPNVEIEIVFEATHQPVEKLLEGRLDLAITSNPIRQESIEYMELFRDEKYAVVSKKHPWAQKEYVTQEDFKHVNLIIHSLPLETVSIYRVLLLPQKIEPQKLTVLPLTEASIEMVKANMGVLVMANWALKPYLNDEVRAIKITENGFFRQQYLAKTKNIEHPLYFNQFIQFLKEELRWLKQGRKQLKTPSI